MDIMEAKTIWADAQKELNSVLPEHARTWFNGTEVSGIDNDTLNILTINAISPQVLKATYYTQIKAALKKVSGKNYDFTITYDDDLRKKYEQNIKKIARQNKPEPDFEKEKDEILKNNLAKMQSNANLNLKYKFENFVVGENSEFAYNLAQYVAQNPAEKKYNPLYIYGKSGVGKTHIMQAIGHYIIFNKPKLRVKYITTETYANELISSLHSIDTTKQINSFRQKFRNVDVLLIDDIQFIESKKKTIDEIFNNFDYLLNKNKQIVITSDRLPSEMPDLPARLLNRFQWGITTEITPPSFETRVLILKNLAEQDGMTVDKDVLEYIANHFDNNVRELEGAYNKVSAYAAFAKKSLSLELAKKVLKCDESKKKITLTDIAKVTAEYFGVTIDDFKSPARAQKISSARHIAVYLSREITGESFEEIAEFYNKKHPTMLYSHEKIKKDLMTDKELENSLSEIYKKLKG